MTSPRRSRTQSYDGARLPDEPLRLESLPHLRPRRDALDVRLEVRPLAEIDLQKPRPVRDREEIGVGDRELRAHEEGASVAEMLVDVREAVVDEVRRELLVVGGHGWVEQRTERLVELRGDEVEPLLQTVALDRAIGRR